jgi:hypothetical protein
LETSTLTPIEITLKRLFSFELEGDEWAALFRGVEAVESQAPPLLRFRIVGVSQVRHEAESK